MKKMNRRILELEQGTIGSPIDVNTSELNRALNAWARRRGIRWDTWRGTNDALFRKPPKKIHENTHD